MNFVLALVAAILVVVIYSRISDTTTNTGEYGTYQQEYPAWFANLPDNYAPEQMDFTFAAEKTIHGVVHVTTTFDRDPRSPFAPPGQQQQQEGIGSGIIITDDGYIGTNYHVIQEATEVEITLNDGQAFIAEVVGSDPSTDIAVLKIDAQGLPVVEMGNSDDLRVGEWVLAVGNPLNLTSTVTAGIVSAMARGLGVFAEREMAIESFIQTDAPLNPGSSGGALVNLQGELVGMPTLIMSPTGAYAGNSFAVPVSIVRKVVTDIMEFGEVKRAVLGFQIRDVDSEIAREEGLEHVSGVYIVDVMEEGAARDAGIRQGDVVIELDGQQVRNVAQLQEKVSLHRPDDEVTLLISRDGEKQEIEVTLGRLEN